MYTPPMHESSAEVFVRALGPLSVGYGTDRIHLTGTAATVLAVLIAHHPEVTEIDQLADSMWPTELPDHPDGAVHTAISRLRSRLAPRFAAVLVATRPTGYLLDTPRETIDVFRFEDLVTEARTEDDPTQRLGLYSDAVDLWLGRPFGTVGMQSPRIDAIALRLEMLRLETLAGLHGARLELGKAAEAIPDLWQLVTSDGHHEPFWQLLVRALARAGRHIEASRAYERYADLLRNETGLEPALPLGDLV